MKSPALLLILLGLSGCAVINYQRYYIPSGVHQNVKENHYRHSYIKMVYNRVKVTGSAGDSIGSITVNTGVGQPILMGPLIFPVVPVGGFFQKRSSRFEMFMDVRCNNGYFMPLAIDSSAYKRVSDSLNKLKVGTVASLNTKDCYLIVNDSLKVPLRVDEFFLGDKGTHGYRMHADIPFRKARNIRLVTGNALLDRTLKSITFTRHRRLVFDLLGLN